MFDTTVVKVDPKYKDRLYLVNNLLTAPSKGARFIWNNPTGGAIEWTFYPQNAIIDTTGLYVGIFCQIRSTTWKIRTAQAS